MPGIELGYKARYGGGLGIPGGDIRIQVRITVEKLTQSRQVVVKVRKVASYERGLRIPVPNRFGKEDLILRGLGAVSDQSISQPVASTSTGCGLEWQPTRSRTFHVSGKVWPAAANRRSAVRVVGARLVSTVGIQVSNFSPQSLLLFRNGAACGASDFCFHIRRNRSLCWTNEIKRYTEKHVESVKWSLQKGSA